MESDLLTIQDGEYAFDPRKLSLRHDACFEMFKVALVARCDVAVSNTFTTLAEIEPYIEAGRRSGSVVRVHWMQGDFGSVHGVPDVVLQKMRDRWEPIPNEIHHTFRTAP